jgi:translation initiation factor IF-2
MTTGAKMRVYEIAREVGIPNKDLLAKIRAMGLEVNNHMSSLDADAVAKIKRTLEKERGGAPPPDAKPSGGAVLRRRSPAKTDDAAAPAVSAVPPVVRRRQAVVDEPVEAKPVEPAAPVVRRRAVEAVEPAVEARAEVHVPDKDTEPPAAAPTVEVAEVAEVAAPDAREDREGRQGRQDQDVEEGSTAVTPVAEATAPTHEPPPPIEPVAAEPAPVTAAVPDAEPRATDDGRRPAEIAGRSRVIIAGPSVVSRPGAESRPTAAQPAQTQPARQPAVFVRQRDPAREAQREAANQAAQAAAQGPRTVTEVAETARSRFEAELERARARMAEREAERATVPASASAAAPAEAAEAPATDGGTPGRPAVGTIIALPTRIKITERTPARGGGVQAQPVGGPGQIRGRFAQQQQTGRGGPGGGKSQVRDFGRKKLPLHTKGKGKQTLVTEPAAHKRVIRIEDSILVADLARGMGVKATEVLKKLWGMGMTGVNINAAIDVETAQILASEFGYEVQNVAFKEEDIFADQPDDADKMQPRAPVVTVMGHVDHGKTSLLDQIRKARVAAGEAGGITQHIAAYKIPAAATHGEVVFLDTPGHEAFTEMRARGAEVTDIVVLVVAANDGVMPQTVEALNHAKAAKVPIIVAVNKIDLPDAQPERIRQQLADHGLIPEEWGGDTQYVNVSALRGENIDRLLETIAVVAEIGELRANPDKPGQGTVVEARLDRARGPMATVLIQEGTLKVGDFVVAGRTVGRVRAILDDRGEQIKEAGPSTPIEILGLDGVPEAGDTVNAAEDERAAKQVVEHRRQQWRKRELASTAKVSLENLMERMSEDADKELKIVLKADVQGSAEALKAALVKLTTDKVKVIVISAGVGGITESDVNLAKAGGAIIVGFHVRPAGKSAKLAEQEGVQIRLYDIIYDALDEVKSAMAGLLAPIKREVAMGKLEVRETFTIPKVGTIAGCMVTDGRVTRKALLRIVRDAVQIYEGRVGSLRRFKEDVAEVQQGYECGVMVAGFNDLKPSDVIEAYEVVEEAAKL